MKFNVGEQWISSNGNIHTILSVSAKGERPIITQWGEGPVDSWTEDGCRYRGSQTYLEKKIVPKRTYSGTLNFCFNEDYDRGNGQLWAFILEDGKPAPFLADKTKIIAKK